MFCQKDYLALLWPWVLQFFVFYRPVTEKLLFTVSFDHPECWYYYPFFVVVKYCTFWPLSVNEKRNSTVAAFSNWVDAATNFYRQPPLYSLVATCKAGSGFFCLQVVRRKLLQKVMVDYCIHSKKDLVSSNKGSRPSKTLQELQMLSSVTLYCRVTKIVITLIKSLNGHTSLGLLIKGVL